VRRYIPYTERFPAIAQEHPMPDKPKRLISNMRQSNGAARQQQQMNRLQHSRWERDLHSDFGWKWAVAVGLAIAGLLLFGIMQGEMPL
jgi:hypothetical protein